MKYYMLVICTTQGGTVYVLYIAMYMHIHCIQMVYQQLQDMLQVQSTYYILVISWIWDVIPITHILTGWCLHVLCIPLQMGITLPLGCHGCHLGPSWDHVGDTMSGDIPFWEVLIWITICKNYGLSIRTFFQIGKRSYFWYPILGPQIWVQKGPNGVQMVSQWVSMDIHTLRYACLRVCITYHVHVWDDMYCSEVPKPSKTMDLWVGSHIWYL